jgi:hypothetical protein
MLHKRLHWVAGALFLLANSAAAQTTYADALFSIQVPAGWQAAKLNNQPDGVSITKGGSYVNAGVGPGQNGNGQSAKDLSAGYEKGLGPGCQALKHLDATLASLPASYLLLSCNDPQAGPLTMSVSIATSHGDVVFFNTGGLAAEYAGDQAAFDAMEKSFRLNPGNAAPPTAAKAPANTGQMAALERACAAGVFTPEECTAKRAALSAAAAPPAVPNAPAAGGDQMYRDPGGRFTVSVPQGWALAPQGPNGAAGVQITQGLSWMMIGPFGGTKGPGDVVDSLQKQFAGTYKNFAQTSHNPFQLNGREASLGMYTGVNPKGTPVSLVIIGVAGPRQTQFAIFSSVPQGDNAAVSNAMTSILNSIQFLGDVNHE